MESDAPLRLKGTNNSSNCFQAECCIEQQSVAVETRFCAAGEVEAYPVEMHQVFSNLLLNAMEAAGNGGQVVVEIADQLNGSVDAHEHTMRRFGTRLSKERLLR